MGCRGKQRFHIVQFWISNTQFFIATWTDSDFYKSFLEIITASPMEMGRQQFGEYSQKRSFD